MTTLHLVDPDTRLSGASAQYRAIGKSRSRQSATAVARLIVDVAPTDLNADLLRDFLQRDLRHVPEVLVLREASFRFLVRAELPLWLECLQLTLAELPKYYGGPVTPTMTLDELDDGLDPVGLAAVYNAVYALVARRHRDSCARSDWSTAPPGSPGRGGN